MIGKSLMCLAATAAIVGTTAGACGGNPCAKLPPPDERRIGIVLEGDEVERTVPGDVECEVVKTPAGGFTWQREAD